MRAANVWVCGPENDLAATQVHQPFVFFSFLFFVTFMHLPLFGEALNISLLFCLSLVMACHTLPTHKTRQEDKGTGALADRWRQRSALAEVGMDTAQKRDSKGRDRVE